MSIKIFHICGRIAWIYRIKLPKNYKFIALSSHGVGHNVFWKFLKECRVRINWHCFEQAEIVYLRIWDTLISGKILKKHNNAIVLAEYGFIDSAKLFSLIDSSVPCVILVRDPISIIKTNLNFQSRNADDWLIIGENYNKVINIEFDSFVTETFTGYRKFVNKPYIDGVQYITRDKNQAFFIQNSLIKALPDLTKIYYVDTSEILPDKAFETMKRLSSLLSFPTPKPSRVYEQKLYGAFTGLLPLTLKVPYTHKQENHKILYGGGGSNKTPAESKQSCKKQNTPESSLNLSLSSFLNRFLSPFCKPKEKFLQIIITVHEDNTGLIDIGIDIMDSFFTKFKTFQNIKLYIDAKDKEKILESKQEIKDYLLGYFKELKNYMDMQAKNKITEEQILEYFRNHPDIRAEFKAKLDYELDHVKKHAPHIVSSWKYYQEFEKMCKLAEQV